MLTRQLPKFYDAQGLVEYSLILALIMLAVVATLALLGPQVSALLQQVVASFP